MKKNILSIGAEAVLTLDKKRNIVIKERVPKSYRIEELDKKIRTFRTRREAKVLSKLEPLGFTPKLIRGDNNHVLEIEYINGNRLSEVLESQNIKSISAEIGKKIKKMHDAGVIHGDLTTSNMILTGKIYFIDFGLSFFSEKIEDKAVDLHLLGQALESKHHTISNQIFEKIKDAYADKDVLIRLEQVEKRGRNKIH
ncbi:MAG: KEOPS complex kinase/ATPase Bud32 [Candidatus Woesearchaeota archaeon]|jgi:Kae1-associated kinase Bud32